MRHNIKPPVLAVAALVLWMAGCASQPAQTVDATGKEPEKSLTEKLRAVVASEIEVPGGTELQVRLNQSVGSARSEAGEEFDATLHAPVVVGDKVVVPKGAIVHGHVIHAVASGHLKTPARLSVTLDTLEWQGKSYPITTSSVSRSARSHKNRNLALIGGGSGAGALIGGLAGGGTGALIGAGAGAAAGTAGAYATGRKDVLLPAESLLTFRLQAPVKIRK
ncbi:MAG: hypothetical protein HY238_08670 [Acidobacteria bacterium]|nr:hypothetical protein [Acidobacteriota bacterium]